MAYRAIYCCNEALDHEEFEQYGIEGICPICNEDWLAACGLGLCTGCMMLKVDCVGGEDCGPEDV